MNAKLISISVSLPKVIDFQGVAIATGIYKSPVSGSVKVYPTNLAGDGQADLTVHGGPHKAVYVYPVEHYAHWNQVFSKEYLHGFFGENFTTEGMDERSVHIGDQYRIGTAQFEVTQPRVPCYKMIAKIGRREFAKLMMESRRTGFYLKVLGTGVVQAGDPIVRTASEPDALSVREFLELAYLDRGERKLLSRALAMRSLIPEWRQELEQRQT